jgi:hypothetical protein
MYFSRLEEWRVALIMPVDTPEICLRAARCRSMLHNIGQRTKSTVQLSIVASHQETVSVLFS